jgi:hypothetical protein
MLGMLASFSHFYVLSSAVSVAATASFVVLDILKFQFIILDQKNVERYLHSNGICCEH